MSQDDESFAKEIFSILKWFSVFLVVILLFFVWLLLLCTNVRRGPAGFGLVVIFINQRAGTSYFRAYRNSRCHTFKG